jgi:hypothetical protein
MSARENKMPDLLNVKFKKHVPPFMPGDKTTLHAGRAKMLGASGALEILSGADAAEPASRGLTFDPAKSEIEEVRAFILGQGDDIPANAKPEKLRELAAALQAKAAE